MGRKGERDSMDRMDMMDILDIFGYGQGKLAEILSEIRKKG